MIVWSLSWEARIAALRSWLASRLSVRVDEARSELLISDGWEEARVPLPRPSEPADPWESWSRGGARL